MTDSFKDELESEFPDSSITVIEPEEEVIEGHAITISKGTMEDAIAIRKFMIEYTKRAMEPDVDYGKIPGTPKKTLFKPGAEKLQRLFRFKTETILQPDGKIEQWDVPIGIDTFPLFHYRYITKVWDREDNLLTTCEGEANSYEAKYRWRRVLEYAVPAKYRDRLDELDTTQKTEIEFTFAIESKQTEGKYGKPMEYWESWEEDIKNGVARQTTRKTRKGESLPAWERGGTFYLIPNEDIYTQVNTIMKISQKRSYVGGINIASSASEFFTQDLEDATGVDYEESETIYAFVPDRTTAAKALVRYASSLGIEKAGDRIKVLLEENEIAWSLDNWNEIIEMVEKDARG